MPSSRHTSAAVPLPDMGSSTVLGRKNRSRSAISWPPQLPGQSDRPRSSPASMEVIKAGQVRHRAAGDRCLRQAGVNRLLDRLRLLAEAGDDPLDAGGVVRIDGCEGVGHRLIPFR